MMLYAVDETGVYFYDEDGTRRDVDSVRTAVICHPAMRLDVLLDRSLHLIRTLFKFTEGEAAAVDFVFLEYAQRHYHLSSRWEAWAFLTSLTGGEDDESCESMSGLG